MVGAAVPADLNLIMGRLHWEYTGQCIAKIPLRSAVRAVVHEGFLSEFVEYFFTLQRMFTAMESGNLKAWKKA